MEKLRIFYLKYKHAIPLIIYGIIYMTWFAWLEKNTTGHYRIIHMAADDYIPFVKCSSSLTFCGLPMYRLWSFISFQGQRGLLPHLYLPLHGHDDFPDRIHPVAQRTAPSSRCYAERQYLHPYGSRSVSDRHSYQPVAQHSCI